MAKEKTQRRSGRRPESDDAPPKSKKSEKKQAAAQHARAPGEQELHSPWWPLMWMLLPLIACVIYGVLTRVF
jgi:hypothetical protein